MNHENDNQIDPDISDLYQSTRNEGPGAALDAAILAQAEAAVAPKRKRPAWIAPVGLAATVLLGVNLAVNLKDYSSDPDIYSEAARPAAQSADKFESSQAASSAETSQDAVQDKLTAPAVPRLAKMTAGESQTDDERVVMPAPVPQAQADLATESATSTADNLTPGASQSGLAELKDRDDSGDRAVAVEHLMRAVENSALEKRRKRRTESTPLIVQGERERADFTSSAPRQTEPESPHPGITAAAVVAVPATPERASAKTISQSAPAIISVEPQADANVTMVPTPPPALEKQASEDSGLEEVVVTGSKVDDRYEYYDSPHRRLTAKDQILRNEQREPGVRSESIEESDSSALSALTNSAPTYMCDLDALRISKDVIELAKVEARNFEPPLNAVSWQQYIRELAANGDYVSACVQLAAFRQIFPDVALIRPLPVALPPSD